MKFFVTMLLMLFLCARPGLAETPAGRCASLGTNNAVLEVPESLAPAVNAAFGTSVPPSVVASNTVYRCAGGAVMVCSFGANLNCGQADTSRMPTAGEIAWCKGDTDAAFIPAVAAGHDTVFAWGCKKGAPMILKQMLDVDDQGFVKQYWKKL